MFRMLQWKGEFCELARIVRSSLKEFVLKLLALNPLDRV